jgi:dsDNA-specific endonuclease/ATPase MutS2
MRTSVESQSMLEGIIGKPYLAFVVILIGQEVAQARPIVRYTERIWRKSMNDLNDLMARLEADPTITTPQDLDQIIEYYRGQRRSKEAGVKPKKASTEAKPIDLKALGLVSAKPKVIPGFKRRV